MNEYSTLLGDAVLRRRARSAENTARIESELAGRVKSEFISNMSHELRTPLNTVIGFSKLLAEHERRKLETSEIVEYANLISDAASHLLSIINDVLDISKMQSGKYAIDSRETDIDDIVISAISSFRKLAQEAKVELISTIGLSLPPVRGDSAKLKQAIGNLINNAVKFTPAGGKVTVEVLRRSSGGVSIMIRDTGVGMTDQELAIAITPFGQVDGTRTRWREGTGLGLPIAKALIELHGGDIAFKSTKGVGTDVSITLPPFDQVSNVIAPQALSTLNALE